MWWQGQLVAAAGLRLTLPAAGLHTQTAVMIAADYLKAALHILNALAAGWLDYADVQRYDTHKGTRRAAHLLQCC